MAIISIDYDDTLVYADYPNVGVLKEFAALAVNQLYSEGHTIIIWTCRSGDHETQAKEYLERMGVMFHHINENHPENVAKYDSDSRKIFADIYIDDKQLGGLPDSWLEILDRIKEQIKNIK